MDIQVETIVRLTMQAMLLSLYISAPAVVVSAVVGLGVAFIQAVTSLQDASISAGIKLIAVTIAVIGASAWGAGMILSFAQATFAAIFWNGF